MADKKSIVVGVDFSRFSLSALEEAARLARAQTACLEVVHVVDPHAVADLQPSAGATIEDVRATFVEEARSWVLNHMSTIAGRPAEVRVSVPVGNPLQEILRIAHETRAELLVLGEKGTWAGSQGPGTLATQCVRKADTEVLLVRESHRGPFRRVVVCVDGSPTSELALSEAIGVARQDQAHLDVIQVHATPGPRIPWRVPPAPTSPDRDTQWRHQTEESLRRFVESRRDELDELRAHVHAVLSVKVWVGIVGFLRNTAADLAVLGTRGRTGWKRLLLGTTAERVVRESPCSVLAVKPDDFHYVLE